MRPLVNVALFSKHTVKIHVQLCTQMNNKHVRLSLEREKKRNDKNPLFSSI